MPETTTPHPAGAPCWVYMAATDQQLALDLYRELFGWKGESGDNTVCELNGKTAACVGSAKFLDSAGAVFPRDQWIPLLACPDLEATTGSIFEARGSAGAQLELGKLGKLQQCKDPQGAEFGLWQPGECSGAQITGQAGAMSWFELRTSDTHGAKKFYGDVFGYTFESQAGGDTMRVGNRDIGTLVQIETRRPYWRTYFEVDNIPSAEGTVVKHEGDVRAEGGRMFVKGKAYETSEVAGALTSPDDRVGSRAEFALMARRR
ncbi:MULTISPECIES: glyoxalase [Streptomyces]|uniref:glyoxalase n=1 Tax=Streptomyces TaxID=1883 RepID=UPI000BFDE8D3|nr:glyoxalase [Streptomyces sp. or3]WTC75314.1 VOC family protein [Streptomyces anulatus]WUD87299.1 VOC family protein [Streptomyces anulatus]